jgi:hypothetical protein
MSNPTQNELRRSFIGMLFALVVATSAEQFADLLLVATDGWTFRPLSLDLFNNLLHDHQRLLAPLSHSVLALLLVSMSWVMWSKSQARGHSTEIQSILSTEFVLLLIEVFLVTLYFSIVKSSEQDISKYTASHLSSDFIKPTSARPEALQMMCVFATFFVWDLIADVLKSPRSTTTNISLTQRAVNLFQGICTFCSISLVCIVGAWLVSTVSPNDGPAFKAVLGDAALITLLLFFRGGKALEYYLIKLFPGEGARQNTMRNTPPSSARIIILTLLICAFAASLLLSRWPPCFLQSLA